MLLLLVRTAANLLPTVYIVKESKDDTCLGLKKLFHLFHPLKTWDGTPDPFFLSSKQFIVCMS